MRHFRKLACLCVLLTFWPCAPRSHAADRNTAADIAAVNSRDDLYTKGSQLQDLKLLSSVWADTFIDTNGSGVVRNKQQMLAVIAASKKSGQKILSIKISDQRTQIYGDAAVITGMYTDQVLAKGSTVVARGRFTDVWIKQGNTWNCVAAHSSPIP